MSDPTSDGVQTIGQFREAKDTKPAVLVGTSTCGFCSRAKEIFKAFLSPDQMALIDCDQVAEGAAIRAEAAAETEHKTVPMIFIRGQFIGGCDKLVELKNSGELYTMLDVPPPEQNASLGPDRAPPPRNSCLFYFPHTVNIYPVRGIALQMVAICIVGIIFREDLWAAWLVTAMAFDFLVRMVGGAAVSPAGGLAMLATSFLKEDLRCGPPKQFATFVGLCFSVTAAVLLHHGEEVAGAVVLGCLAGPAALEAFMDFCLGCWFFGMMVKFGLVRKDVYDVHIEQRPVMERTLGIIDDFSSDLKKVNPMVFHEAGQPITPADQKIKQYKNDDHVRRGFNPTKYVQLSDFMMPLGVAGLAFAFRMASNTYSKAAQGRMVDRDLWHAVAWIAVALFGMLTLMYVGKIALHTRKVIKEIVHPVKSNYAAAMPMCLCLFSILLVHEDTGEDERIFGEVLFWIGAVLLKVLLVWKMAWLVGNRGDDELVTPTILMPLCGCMVAGLAAPFFEAGPGGSKTGYFEVGFFFFSLSGLLGILLFGTTFMAAIKYHWSDERIRPSVGMWVAVVYMFQLGYLVLTRGTGILMTFQPPTATSTMRIMDVVDSVTMLLFYAGLSLFLVMVWLALPMGFLFRMKFDFSFWAIAFPLDLLAAASCLYLQLTLYTSLHAQFAEYLAYFTLALASWANACLFLQTLYWLSKRRWLRPAYKWAPLSFNKLTHEAFREVGETMLRYAEALSAEATSQKLWDGETAADAVASETVQSRARGLAYQWQQYAIVLEWHAKQEDNILFRHIDVFHPFATKDGYLQHQVIHEMEATLNTAAAELVATHQWQRSCNEALRTMVITMREYVPFMARHMDWEEECLLPLNRRSFNTALQMEIVRKIWNAYEGRTVEEVLGGSSEKNNTSWSNYHTADFGKDGATYTFPKVPREAIFEFPPTHPHEPIPLAKQQVMRVVLPFVVNHLPMAMQKTRFVKSLVWALPERAQAIGDMLYRGTEDTTWAALVIDVPEIIPRGLPGWTRRV